MPPLRGLQPSQSSCRATSALAHDAPPPEAPAQGAAASKPTRTNRRRIIIGILRGMAARDHLEVVVSARRLARSRACRVLRAPPTNPALTPPPPHDPFRRTSPSTAPHPSLS